MGKSATKIDIKQIINNVNTYIDQYCTKNINDSNIQKNDNKMIFDFISSSSDRFNRSTHSTLTTILPLYLIIAGMFYEVEDNGTLEEDQKSMVRYIQTKTLTTFASEEPSLEQMNYVNTKVSNINKYIDIQKNDFIKQNFVLFNSNSDEHENVFGFEKVKNIKKNYVLKIKGIGAEETHIRIGVICNEDSKFTLSGISKKKTRL